MGDIKYCDDRLAKMKWVRREVKGNLKDPRLKYDMTNREVGTLPFDDTRERFQWVSEVAYKNIHRIVTRGYDTTELVEEGYGVVDVIFIDFQARIPLIEERDMLEYLMVLGLEDGLSNPALVSMVVAKGKCYASQAAGSSVLAFGHAYASYDAFGKMMNRYLARIDAGTSIQDAAKQFVEENKYEDHFGISDLYLKDPAARRILDRVEKTVGPVKKLKYVPFMREVIKVAKAELGNVDVDMIGAMCSAMMDLGFTEDAAWAIMAVTRAYGAGAHALEVMEARDYDVLGQTLTPKEWYTGPADKPVPPLSESASYKGGQAQTPDEWKAITDAKAKLGGTGFAIPETVKDPRHFAKKK